MRVFNWSSCIHSKSLDNKINNINQPFSFAGIVPPEAKRNIAAK